MSGWVHRTGKSPEINELQSAVRQLADQAAHAPGQTGQVFAKVTNVALVATAVLSGALAAVHLWKALSRHHKEYDAGPRPEAAGAGQPPRHLRRSAPALAGGDAPHRPHSGRNL